MPLIGLHLLALFSAVRTALCIPQDVATGDAFALGAGEQDIVAARLSDAVGVACGADAGNGNTGLCRLIEMGAGLSGSVAGSLVADTDENTRNAIAGMGDGAAVWCFVDQNNAGQVLCRKLMLANSTLEAGVEQSVAPSEANDATLVSVASFSSTRAIVCFDVPGASPSGQIRCTLLRVDDGELINAGQTVAAVGEGAHSLSISHFSGSDTVLACYAVGSSLECVTLSLSGAGLDQLQVGSAAQLSASGSSGHVATSRLADGTAVVCHAQAGQAACRTVSESAGNLTKGSEISVGGGASRLSVEGFSAEGAVLCYRASAQSECYALELSGGEFARGNKLALPDAAAGHGVALTSVAEDLGFLCYTSSDAGSGSAGGACAAVRVEDLTTTSQTSTVSKTFTVTTASETTTSRTTITTSPFTVTLNTGTTTTVSTGSSSATSTTSPHSTTATETTTSPHTTTDTSATSATDTTTIADSGATSTLVAVRTAVVLPLAALATLAA